MDYLLGFAFAALLLMAFMAVAMAITWASEWVSGRVARRRQIDDGGYDGERNSEPRTKP